jgi:hypothetical protein
VVGDRWISSVTGKEYSYVDDGDSLQWVEVASKGDIGPQGPTGPAGPAGASPTLTNASIVTALGYTPYNVTNPAGYISGITGGMVTTALGYTPWHPGNFDPSTKANLASPAFTGTPTIGGNAVLHDWRQSILGTGSYMWGWWRMRNTEDTHTVHLSCSVAGAFVLANTPWTLSTFIVDQSGNMTAAGNVTAFSDERLKKDFQLEALTLEQILEVSPESFTRIDTGERQAGVRAQALQQVIPLAVYTHEDGTLSVDYGRAAMLMVLNLALEVALLKGQIAMLKGEPR